MSPFLRGATVLAAVSMLFGSARRAHAQGSADEQPIRIQYTAHDGCPDALGFFWYVRARTQRVRLAAPGESADLATIDIVQADGKSRGTLELPPVDGRPFTRQVEAASCSDVVLALSLVVALSYDPDATTTFPTVVTAPPSEPAPPVQPAPVLVLPPPAAPPEPVESPRRMPPYGAAAGLMALGFGGVAPSLQAVLAPFFEYGSNAQGLWHPRLRASFLVQVPATDVQKAPGLSATLFFLAGQLSGCPISVRLNQDVAVSPCLAVDVGQIFGNAGASVQGRQSGSLWWVALEATAHLRSTLAGPVFAEVTGSVGIPLAPGEFVLQGDGGQVSVHKIPTVFGSFGLGLGVHFP
jgi:hypothetical protein